MGKLNTDRYGAVLFGNADAKPDATTVSPSTRYICLDTGELYVERNGAWLKVFYDDPNYASSTTSDQNRKAKTAALADDSSALEGWSKAQVMLMASEVFGE